MAEQEKQNNNQGQWQLPKSAQSSNDALMKCLVLLTRFYDHPFSEETLAAGLPLDNGRLTPDLFGRAADRAGLNTKLIQRTLDKISPLTLPAVLLMKGQRACILRAVSPDGACEVIDADTGGAAQSTLAAVGAEYTGHALLVHPKLRFDTRTELSAVPRVNHWFWGVVGQAWPIYGEVLLASLLINLFALAIPLYTMNVYDRVVPNDTTETLWALTAGVVIVLVFDFSMRMLRGYLTDIAGKRIDVILSANIFERAMGIRMEARPPSVGSFASNVQEFESFREFITSATITALVDLPFLVIFIFVIYIVGGWLAVVPIAAVPLVIIISLILQRQLGAVIQESFRCGAQKQGVLIESLTAVETIKSMSAESVQQRRWEQLVGQVAKLGLKSKTLSQGIINSSQLIQQVANIAIVVFGVYLINDRLLTIGGLIACTMLNSRALAPLGQVAGLLARYHQSAASLRTLNNVMNLPIERPANKSFVHRPVIVGSIEFREVTFTYPGHKVPALSNVSFKIAAGERVGLIGRIGSGKSTIEKLILSLYKPESGSILIDGVDVNQIDPAALRRNVGYVPQDIVLFFGTVKENILYAAPYAEDAAMLRAAEIAGVTEFIHPAEQGFVCR